MTKVRTGVSLDNETLKDLTQIAQEQGLSTPLRINISAAIKHVTTEYKRLTGKRLVDCHENYTTRQPG